MKQINETNNNKQKNNNCYETKTLKGPRSYFQPGTLLLLGLIPSNMLHTL